MTENKERLQTLLHQTQENILSVIEKTWGANQGEKLPETLVEHFDLLLADFFQLGDAAYEKLATEKSLLVTYLNYSWHESAKKFLILWRDVTFQQYKAQLLAKDGRVSPEAILKLCQDSKAVIAQAALDMFTDLEVNLNQLEAAPKLQRRQLEKWLAQQPPYPVYRQQFLEIQQQSKYLKSQFLALNQTANLYKEIETLIKNKLEKAQNEINSIREKSIKMLEFIQENLLDQPNELKEYIEDKLGEINPTYSADAFRSVINDISSKLNLNLQVPVDTQLGKIQYREISLQKSTLSWLDSILFPIIYQSQEIVENTSNALKMALLNVRNLFGVKFGEDKRRNEDSAELIRPLTNYLDRLEQFENRQGKLVALLHKELQQEFYAAKMLNVDAPFLPLQDLSKTQFNFQNAEWIKPLRSRLKNRFQFFEKFRTKVAQEEVLSDAEKVVRFIQSREMDQESQDYNSIFLARGYVGESFWVGRQKELDHIDNLIQQWNADFRGAVIISGQPLSGKTLFGTLVAKQFFQDDVIRLSPNSIIEVNGRRLETTYNLEETLIFIRKNSINQRRMVWIDDLELWNDPARPLLQNVRALCHHIDAYSRQVFFMVSMNNWLKVHLEKTLQFGRAFQAEINLDQIGIEDMRQAILTRHGATHRVMVNKNGLEINSPQFRKITKQIYRASGGNIGEALLHWAFLTTHYDEDRVKLELDYSYSLPKFINPDTAILLVSILMQKRTNEYRLLQHFGPPFKSKYKGILQRLINIGLLRRYPDGWLEVNKLVVNELGQTLDRLQYLKFYHQN